MMPPQFRGMMPPYMYGRAGFPAYPPNYHPGMPRPPYPFPDQRFRGPHPGGVMPPRPQGAQMGGPADGRGEEGPGPKVRSTIIKDQDLKEFDELLRKENNDGWAGAGGDLDFR